ncbi:hypothetical protein COZ22_01775 [bacterium (Candidatus Howlettbacteria) CG_4_10_14_3_um_filter_37_10]|nr:MAG: hypothetical protein COX25_03100 [bacterium (Candidatus Howlettbacteria) CG23_combo_of_CG06-09_8_20_14_all_37_9]PIX99754.1 MAG: hypothetical protein COZ22_01775 [bacterium (Candidatus Howlettbacteria) CG_4_10_14_3_um_filter_37_10]PJB06669.1 MAG: hypothetical protein CO123_01605 [bacterium (Candidatus Howlettbacteria) CG_4_9_14_3_um_filter_37_10]
MAGNGDNSQLETAMLETPSESEADPNKYSGNENLDRKFFRLRRLSVENAMAVYSATDNDNRD